MLVLLKFIIVVKFKCVLLGISKSKNIYLQVTFEFTFIIFIYDNELLDWNYSFKLIAQYSVSFLIKRMNKERRLDVLHILACLLIKTCSSRKSHHIVFFALDIAHLQQTRFISISYSFKAYWDWLLMSI